MTLLIDADWLVFSSCCAGEVEIQWDTWNHTLHSNAKDCLSIIEARLEVYKTIAKAQQPKVKHDVVMCFSEYPTFRHDIFPEYKIHRIGKRKPLAMKHTIDLLKQDFECVSYPNLEGDDVLGLLATNGQYENPVVVSVDKDMRTIPCMLIAAEEVEHITEKKAMRQWFEMAIAGDSTDGIIGVKGLGMVTASKLLADTPDTQDALWSKVAETYTKKGYSIADAILNARLTRILREGDYNYSTGEVKLWNP